MSPNLLDQAPCDPYVQYTKDAVTDTMKNNLLAFIENNNGEFNNIGNSRDIIYYGEYEYKYSGGEHKALAMPPLLEELAQSLKPHMTNPESILNSCLITSYKDGSDFIPLQRDDEPFFNPDSEIVTASIGENRSMNFLDNADKKSIDLI